MGNLSWQEVNSMDCMILIGVGVNRGWLMLGAPNTQRIFGLSLVHVHFTNHSRLVMSCGLEFWFLA